jgi:ribosomal protein L37AE/L43A
MSELRRSNKPLAQSNNYLTQCKACNLGVYRTQRWVWSCDPLGIVHEDCTVR